MSSRQQNERKFQRWDELPQGGRRYTREVRGHSGWVARYLKEVDAEENTMNFRQEIYNSAGQLVEVHEKYPVDKGHRKV